MPPAPNMGCAWERNAVGHPVRDTGGKEERASCTEHGARMGTKRGRSPGSGHRRKGGKERGSSRRCRSNASRACRSVVPIFIISGAAAAACGTFLLSSFPPFLLSSFPPFFLSSFFPFLPPRRGAATSPKKTGGTQRVAAPQFSNVLDAINTDRNRAYRALPPARRCIRIAAA